MYNYSTGGRRYKASSKFTIVVDFHHMVDFHVVYGIVYCIPKLGIDFLTRGLVE